MIKKLTKTERAAKKTAPGLHPKRTAFSKMLDALEPGEAVEVERGDWEADGKPHPSKIVHATFKRSKKKFAVEQLPERAGWLVTRLS